jgi:hypothetical protein
VEARFGRGKWDRYRLGAALARSDPLGRGLESTPGGFRAGIGCEDVMGAVRPARPSLPGASATSGATASATQGSARRWGRLSPRKNQREAAARGVRGVSRGTIGASGRPVSGSLFHVKRSARSPKGRPVAPSSSGEGMPCSPREGRATKR